jgi:hypothetical protein
MPVSPSPQINKYNFHLICEFSGYGINLCITLACKQRPSKTLISNVGIPTLEFWSQAQKVYKLDLRRGLQAITGPHIRDPPISLLPNVGTDPKISIFIIHRME